MDSHFRETAVLLIYYGLDGATGLVINRLSELEISTVTPDRRELAQRKETLYHGKPVAQTTILLPVGSVYPPESSLPVFDDVCLNSGVELLQRCMEELGKE